MVTARVHTYARWQTRVCLCDVPLAQVAAVLLTCAGVARRPDVEPRALEGTEEELLFDTFHIITRNREL